MYVYSEQRMNESSVCYILNCSQERFPYSDVVYSFFNVTYSEKNFNYLDILYSTGLLFLIRVYFIIYTFI